MLENMNIREGNNTIWGQLHTGLLALLISIILWLLSTSYDADTLSSIQVYLFLLAGTLASTAFAVLHLQPALALLLIFFAYLGRWVLIPTTFLPADIMLLYVLYWVNLRASLNLRIISLIATLFYSFMFFIPLAIQDSSTGTYLFFALTVTLILTTVSFAQLRRYHISQVAAQELEKQQQATAKLKSAELAVVEERTRIAREMHDIVAHTLSVVIAQADGGQYAGASNPQAALNALQTISEMSRAALADIRSIIGVLRDPKEQDKPLRPQPVDADLEQLVTQMQATGANISLVKLGTPKALPAGLGNAIYRICQEALTNTLKHAGPYVTISVILKWKENTISLEVINDGRIVTTTGDGKGNGLIGMQERVAVFGGILETGPRPQGGFRVKAIIPIPPPARS